MLQCPRYELQFKRNASSCFGARVSLAATHLSSREKTSSSYAPGVCGRERRSVQRRRARVLAVRARVPRIEAELRLAAARCVPTALQFESQILCLGPTTTLVKAFWVHARPARDRLVRGSRRAIVADGRRKAERCHGQTTSARERRRRPRNRTQVGSQRKMSSRPYICKSKKVPLAQEAISAALERVGILRHVRTPRDRPWARAAGRRQVV